VAPTFPLPSDDDDSGSEVSTVEEDDLLHSYKVPVPRGPNLRVWYDPHYKLYRCPVCPNKKASGTPFFLVSKGLLYVHTDLHSVTFLLVDLHNKIFCYQTMLLTDNQSYVCCKKLTSCCGGIMILSLS
jgi:hypothetical protein